MARAKRLLPAGCSFHITLRCNSRQRDVLLAVLNKAEQKLAGPIGLIRFLIDQWMD